MTDAPGAPRLDGHHDWRWVIAERARRRLLAPVGLVLLVAWGLLFVASSVAVAGSIVSSAAPDLLEIDALRQPVETELARALPAVFPPSALRTGTAAEIAERMVRDSAVVDEVARAAGDAHAMWRAEVPPVLDLDADVLTPVALAATRDVDLDLARAFSDVALVDPAPIDLPMSPKGASTVGTLRSASILGLVSAVVVLVVAAVTDRRLDQVVRRASEAALALAVVIAATAAIVPFLDLASRGWLVPTLVALVRAARTELLVAAVGLALVGVFARAVAGQVAPLVDRRERMKARRAAGPLPVRSGRPSLHRRGRAVRQQAIEAFFEDREDDADDEAAVAGIEAAEADEPLRVAHDGDGFQEAIAAVERDPRGGTFTAVGEDGEDGADDVDDRTEQDERAASAAADRREALERISGARSRLRTHLPR